MSGLSRAVLDSAVGESRTPDLSTTNPTFYHSPVEPTAVGDVIAVNVQQSPLCCIYTQLLFFMFVFSLFPLFFCSISYD